ncbi:MAG: lipocalin family protein [Parafilimonas sp.]|nr:lipocalin family protein [Parafilimonas sp.]
MKKSLPAILIMIAIMSIVSACSKSGSSGGVIPTVENLSGTYALKALVWVYAGQTINVYDSLDACERDNLTALNSDKTIDYIDAGTVCNPPEDDNGTWDLKGDSLYTSANTNASKIKSFDGKTLVLTGAPDGTIDVVATTTLEKQ